jgi:uncharacterized delta-60 repeat protein
MEGRANISTGVSRARQGLLVLAVGLGIVIAFICPAVATPGGLDLTFSGDGKQTTDFYAGSILPGAGERISAIGLQSDGKIVAVGCASCEDFTDWAVARYMPDGTPDTTFSGDGKLTLDFGCCSGTGGDDYASDLVIQGDGNIVVVGTAEVSPNQWDLALARFTPVGDLDSTFGANGIVTTDFALGGSVDGARSVADQSDGKIVVAGTAETSAHRIFALARYLPDGTLDTGFGGDGLVTTSFGKGDAQAHSLVIRANGKIVVAGVGRGDFALARYNPNGKLDTSFGSDGKVITDFGGSEDGANDLAAQSDGKLVVVGQGGRLANLNFAIARYRPGGGLDKTFSGDGRQVLDFNGQEDVAYGVAIQGNGKLVVAGQATANDRPDFGLARFRTGGGLDKTFSGDGKLRTDFAHFEDWAQDVVIEAGKILAGGTARTKSQVQAGYDNNFALARYLAS